MMKHETVETNLSLMMVLVMIVISIGGLVEIVPLFLIDKTIEKVDGVRPYTPLELRGRDIYVREGCYNCHSQMVRPFRDEALRYGHYSLAAESMYDHPFQWGSKRTGPDLARLGGKYSNEWHVAHLINPQAMVPESIMPPYPWLLDTNLRYENIVDHLAALKVTGVPYSESDEEFLDNIANFGAPVAMTLRMHSETLRGAAVEQYLKGLDGRLDTVIDAARQEKYGVVKYVFSTAKVVHERDVADYRKKIKEETQEFLASLVATDDKGAKILTFPGAVENLEAQARVNWDGDPSRISEMDAMVAYMQVLGTMVDFKQYDEGYLAQFR